ncbi:MAG TPA: WD40 repeat domain-containing protein [Candidatus Deferrimicrobium sp.]|nr:WD40 repeat domain-containing protein [Candidatus Deferrimicrobium sp.]
MGKLALSADGQWILASSSSFSNRVYLFNQASPTPLWNCTFAQNPPSVTISADGQYFVVSLGSSFALFNRTIPTPSLLWTYNFSQQDAGSYYIALSADGAYLFTGSAYHVHLFHRNSSTPLWSYAAQEDIGSVAISQDNQYLVAGGWDTGTVYLFHLTEVGPPDLTLLMVAIIGGAAAAAGGAAVVWYLHGRARDAEEAVAEAEYESF